MGGAANGPSIPDHQSETAKRWAENARRAESSPQPSPTVSDPDDGPVIHNAKFWKMVAIGVLIAVIVVSIARHFHWL